MPGPEEEEQWEGGLEGEPVLQVLGAEGEARHVRPLTPSKVAEVVSGGKLQSQLESSQEGYKSSCFSLICI